MPPEMIRAAFRVAGDDVLIGGQALAVWVQYFGLTSAPDAASITADVDFLAPSAAAFDRVRSYARALHADVFIPNERAMTALVGQAYIAVTEDEIYNIDVLWDVHGFSEGEVAARATTVSIDGLNLKVMHPLHVLRSRLANLYKFTDKQMGRGPMQLRISIDVAREFIRAQLRSAPADALASGRSPIQSYVKEVEQLAVEDAGRKIASRFGIHVADAIDPSLIPAGPFWSKRWPGLRSLMSTDYAARITASLEESSDAPPDAAF